jgi:simple sugar transport system permease protein
MLVGAVTGFVTAVHTGGAAMGVLAAALAGAALNALFAWLVVDRRANQLATGLALMFAGVGLSALLGAPYVGRPIAGLTELAVPGSPACPCSARALRPRRARVRGRADRTRHAVALFSTRWGLALRAVGENPVAAFAAGRNRARCNTRRLLAGALGGIAGADLSIGVARTWAEWMTAGRGFIAVALVIFARWQPRAIAGAYLFGGAISLSSCCKPAGCPSRRSCSTCCRTC